MARQAVQQRAVSIRLACRALGISETGYRYQLRLPHTHRHWGFGLCFLYPENVKGHGWNHQRVYRIYRELALNLRIKPKKRFIREVPDRLVEPKSINDTGSMDFMHDSLPLEWQPHIGSRMRRDLLAKRARDPEDPLRLVIVRDMRLTGFDAPGMHTMYIDKPMRGHGLMQAIARVNRVFRDKPGGLKEIAIKALQPVSIWSMKA